ncbi:hypothetical protein OG539_43325 [Actinacidiphila glaucinigra]|uniref:hypothetical protein n=1 Tax=Streptomyces griseorubiginosus TaxID=67304 RepID=UPI002E81496D|nr:hypothetical protein [Streptomyces griseorubiginosus]WUB50318.1 hypothetical protein OHN19_43720 [Streptomyces griseorubiginosus]
MHRLQPLANGLHTDHPVPGIPFVDDSHIPIDDPAAIEAVICREGGASMGRWERMNEAQGAWLAYTADPLRPELAWAVRHHPEHGRTVLLLLTKDAPLWHSSWRGPKLLFRQGGYWWDGTTWYRPDQAWDATCKHFSLRPVPDATTITAADILDENARTDGGRLLDVYRFDPEAKPPDSWNEHLAMWASQRAADDRPLSQCVVRLSAPELPADQLIGVPKMPKIGHIVAPTLRTYIARIQRELPAGDG